MSHCKQVEAILRKYTSRNFSYIVRNCWNHPELQPSIDALLNDLCALFPTPPSRSDLEAILRKHLSANLSYYDAVHQPFIEALMAWASPAPESLHCEHVYYNKGWWLKHPTHQRSVEFPKVWTTCPICAAPSPTV